MLQIHLLDIRDPTTHWSCGIVLIILNSLVPGIKKIRPTIMLGLARRIRLAIYMALFINASIQKLKVFHLYSYGDHNLWKFHDESITSMEGDIALLYRHNTRRISYMHNTSKKSHQKYSMQDTTYQAESSIVKNQQLSNANHLPNLLSYLIPITLLEIEDPWA
jgi:hypothetical protein